MELRGAKFAHKLSTDEDLDFVAGVLHKCLGNVHLVKYLTYVMMYFLERASFLGFDIEPTTRERDFLDFCA